MSRSDNTCEVASACLGGVHCRYDGKAKTDPDIAKGVEEGRIGLACPERMGGLPCPRPPAQIKGGDGYDVLDGRARVVDMEGNDVTEQFIRGAEQFLVFVRRSNAQRVYLRSRSPSCGVHQIYDGTFTGQKRPGCGVTTALLRRAGIEVIEV